MEGGRREGGVDLGGGVRGQVVHLPVPVDQLGQEQPDHLVRGEGWGEG